MSNKLLVDAWDILAKSLLQLDRSQEAIKHAIHLSPMSLAEHTKTQDKL